MWSTNGPSFHYRYYLMAFSGISQQFYYSSGIQLMQWCFISRKFKKWNWNAPGPKQKGLFRCWIYSYWYGLTSLHWNRKMRRCKLDWTVCYNWLSKGYFQSANTICKVRNTILFCKLVVYSMHPYRNCCAFELFSRGPRFQHLFAQNQSN